MTQQIIIYRDELLRYSETFIPAQVESLSSYCGFYVGTSRPPTARLSVPSDRSLVLDDVVKLPTFFRKLLQASGLYHPGWLARLKTLSPQLIHAHFGPDGLWALPLARKLKIPLVVTFHGYDITVTSYGALFQLYLWRRQQLFEEAHCFIAVSDFIRAQLVQKGCSPDKIVVHYIGVDVGKFTPDPSIPKEPIVLFVGRLTEKKGCEYLIRAMAAVQAIEPTLELVVIGDGPLRSTLEQQAKASLKRYRFLGAQPSEVVRDWMNRALLFSTPSITGSTGDSEALGIVFLEAQAMGLPVVTSKHGGIPEAVTHGETGFLAPEKDWETLAKYLLMLAHNEGLRAQFAIAGRKHIEQKFNLKHNTAKLEAIYDLILQKPTGAKPRPSAVQSVSRHH